MIMPGQERCFTSAVPPCLMHKHPLGDFSDTKNTDMSAVVNAVSLRLAYTAICLQSALGSPFTQAVHTCSHHPQALCSAVQRLLTLLHRFFIILIYHIKSAMSRGKANFIPNNTADMYFSML